MGEILVTGASGLIGGELLWTMESGDPWAVARHRGSAPASTRWLEIDLGDPDISRRLPTRIETVVHLAQSERFREFPSGAMDVFDVNVASTARLLEWSRAAGVRRFIYASSGGIYGQSEQEFTEDDPVGGAGPLGYYLASKQCGELLVESYADFFTVVILRFFFVYGPAQRTSMLVPRLVESVAEGRPVVLQGEDGIRLNPIEVRDAARAVEQAIRLEESQKINVAGAEILPLRRMAEVIGETLGTPPRFEVHPASGPNQLVGDIRKMTRLLTTPRVTFPEGVREICAAREARRRETDPAGGVPNQRGAVA